MNTIEALKQALEALEFTDDYDSEQLDVVAENLRTLIEQVARINEREDFEKWWDDPLSPMGNTGPYADGTTMQWSWEAWQARAALGEKK